MIYENDHSATCFHLPDRFEVPCMDFILRGFRPSASINLCAVAIYVSLTTYRISISGTLRYDTGHAAHMIVNKVLLAFSTEAVTVSFV